MDGGDGMPVSDVDDAAAVAALRRAAKKQRVLMLPVVLVAAGIWAAFMAVVNSWSLAVAVLGAAIFAVFIGLAWWFFTMPTWVRRPPSVLAHGVVISVKLGVLHIRAGDEVLVIGRGGVTSELDEGDSVLVTQLHRRNAAVVVMHEDRGPVVVPATPRQL
ncbi:hypothetical protein SGUI_0622 [Serinicoccus hydrothermalis]|uniref:Uncharacterized protein n=1 Tax=Serinicoccus hydrothermalis TaxID=1758689 RepID=A0A1B1N9C8_9MICO|nr:hypothetical protein [Serinicoccus hydrothermalis]ANS78018.1 hypothetical protein SGUI_0622 [Serinicoccus hydrothermalis]